MTNDLAQPRAAGQGARILTGPCRQQATPGSTRQRHLPLATHQNGKTRVGLTTIPICFSPTEMARSAPAAAPAADEPASYEAALAELDTLVQAMEAGQMPLDRLLEGYRRGARLLEYCRERLQVVEQQVKVLEEGQQKPWTNA